MGAEKRASVRKPGVHPRMVGHSEDIVEPDSSGGHVDAKPQKQTER